MSYHIAPGTDLGYNMICVDADGVERPEADGSLASDKVVATLKAATDTSDIFFLSHGWKGDVPEAIVQFDRWIGQVHAVRPDLSGNRPNGFKPLIVALHWPSLPWGDERLPETTGAVLGNETVSGIALTLREEIDSYARVLSNSETARSALTTILAATRGQGEATPAELQDAYTVLVAESNAAADDEIGSVDATVQQDVKLGSNAIADGFLSAIRQLSFWKMKDRARLIGEKAGGPLLERLRAAAPGARAHLMGHSFGCILVSQSVLSGPKVDSLFLVQGALSLWAFAATIPGFKQPGAFSPVVTQGKVFGPIVATISLKDTAVKDYYPIGARLGRQVVLKAEDKLPKYGGIGTYGIQGVAAEAGPLGPMNTQYPFESGKIYNVECTKVIATGTGPSGAHSDIAHPQVAHLFWQTAMAG
jgi:hypothetical protein